MNADVQDRRPQHDEDDGGELFAGPDSAAETEHSTKLSDDMIRDLCSEQYRVEQYLSSVTPLYCSFGDLNQYADDVSNTDKSCSTTYDSQGNYGAHTAFESRWAYGFSTWGGLTGATILQLNYSANCRQGSHLCNGCSAGYSGCGSSGGCHVRVWCRSV